MVMRRTCLAALLVGLLAGGALTGCRRNADTGGGAAPPERAAEETTPEPAAEKEPEPMAEKTPEPAAETPSDDGPRPLPRVTFETSKGEIVLELAEDEAPNTVANFIHLVEKGFYDGTPFHRVIPDFMVQGGDPTGTGTGGPGYRIPDEISPNLKHARGVISMANTGQPNTGGSQFFITHVPTPWLDGKHAVFGRVTRGMDVVDAIKKGDKIVQATVDRKRDHAYEPKTIGGR